MPLSIGKSGSSRVSTKSTINSQDLGTVDSNHKEKMNFFQERKATLPDKNSELTTLKKKLLLLKKTPHSHISKDIELRISEVQNDIDDIKKNQSEFKYFLDCGPLLFQYYDRTNNTGVDKKYYRRPIRTKGLAGSNRTSSQKEIKNKRTTIDTTTTSNNSIPPMSRREMLDEFKSLTDPNWVKKSESKNKVEESICDICQLPKVLQYKESKYICTRCGIEDTTLLDSDRPSFKDPPPESNYFAYKRINHFNELLAQFQAKESTHIPKEVFEMIRKELKKERKTVKHLDYDLVQRYLKKHSDKKYNQYYDHIFHIINRLNGDKPLNMSPEMESNLRFLFLQIQEPFEKYCPPERKNFISYNFVFYKFCQLLGYKEFLKYFPLLKSKEKLYEQEKIWQKIMDDIGLPYK